MIALIAWELGSSQAQKIVFKELPRRTKLTPTKPIPG